MVLLSGGAGKRLFPLSNDVRAKQFLRLFRNEENQNISMLQRVWGQIKKANLAHSTYISVNKSQVDIIQSQLNNEPVLIIEPDLRDTFPAICLASSFLHDEQGASRDELVCVAPVDSYVQDDYFSRIKELGQSLNLAGADIGLLGVKPTEPSEKYGYINLRYPLGHPEREYHYVESFTEKPDEEKAKELMKKGALWNCGVFVFRLGYILDLLEERNLPNSYPTIIELFDKFPKRSFDYEVVEQADKIIVLPYEGDWKDLGTWESLTEEIDTPLIGRGFIDPSSTNTHLINELDVPIAVLGLDNSVVVASPDGILVAKKPTTAKIKELITFEKQRPMFEERRWGWYRVLDFEKRTDGTEVLTKRLCIFKGRNLSYQIHEKRNEVWTIISGRGEFVLNDQLIQIQSGDVLKIRAGDKHTIKALEEIQFIEVQQGSELIEEDIERICMTWDEVLNRVSAYSTFMLENPEDDTQLYRQ